MWFWFGAILGATVSTGIALLLSGIAEPLHGHSAFWPTILAIVCGGIFDVYGVRNVAPHWHRQVPREAAREMGMRAWARHFGFEMGTGVRTHMTTYQPVILVIFIVLSGSPLFAGLAGLAFGTGRTLLVAQVGLARDEASWDLIYKSRGKRIRQMSAIVFLLIALSMVVGRFINSGHGL